jgi:hypothetical protein
MSCRTPGPQVGGVRQDAARSGDGPANGEALRSDQGASPGGEARQGPGHHVPGRPLRVHGRLARTAPLPDRPGQEDGGLSHHRRHLGRNVRVHNGVGHDLGWIQLEVELQMVSELLAIGQLAIVGVC